jgi:hypothetical protein
MDTISIREVSGTRVRRAASPLGITNHNVLAGVLFPVESRFVGGGRPFSAVQAFATPGYPKVPPPTWHVGIRDFSAKVLEEAARRHRVVGLTIGNVLAGVVCPVTPEWVGRLIEQNVSNIVESIRQGEKEIESGEPLTMLDDVVPE